MRKKFLASLLGCGIFSLGFLQNTSASQTNVYIQNYLYPSSSYTTVTPVGYTYYIRSARELNWVSYMVTQGYNFQGCTIEIMSDLDFSNEGFMPIGTYYVPFQGTINGNGHWMRNLTLNYPGYYSIGFMAKGWPKLKQLLNALGIKFEIDKNLKERKGQFLTPEGAKILGI